MGIAAPDDIGPKSRPDRRSNLTSATSTTIALVFFFGVGLAGGAAYKVYFGEDAGAPVADQASPPPAQNFTGKAAPDLARMAPSAPSALAPPPAPSAAEATKPHAPPAKVAHAAPPAPSPAGDATPAKPDAQPETQPAEPERGAATVPLKKPEKPATVAIAHRTAAALENKGAPRAAPHPPAAPGNAGPYRVQFGAFANEDNARRVQWAIEATGVKVDVSQERGPSGHPLFFLRSPAYPDYASALSAAQAVQHRVNGFVNAIPIGYAILGDRTASEQQAQR